MNGEIGKEGAKLAENLSKDGDNHKAHKMTEDLEKDGTEEIIAAKPKSRFKVAKVEFKDLPALELENECDNEIPKFSENEKANAVNSENSITADETASPQFTICHGDTYMNTYDTQFKTFGHNTLETLPHVDHYRNLLSATGAMKKRPTLLELHDLEQGDHNEALLYEGEKNGGVELAEEVPVEPVASAPPSGPKFGWIKGVLVRCLLNIYGVMLFLRLSWVVGQSGIGLTTVIILLAAVVTIITTLSMSAICTNGDVKGGGAYFLISRSLGPEFGGAIGVIFSVANAVAIAMYVVGFAETIRDILKDYDCLMIDEVNDVRVIGLITVCLLLGLALLGMEWEAKAQLGLLAILLVAVANFIIGSFIPPTTSKLEEGYTSYNGKVFKDNFVPDFREGEGFFSVFSIFFPAATGILAGANISGDLQDAQTAIPKGTLLAIVISSFTYIIMAWIAGGCTLRDAIGEVTVSVTSPVNNTLSAYVFSTLWNDTQYMSGMNNNNMTLSDVQLKNNATYCSPAKCAYGLHNDMQVMQLISAWGPITIAGIISATLSSALASLVSAPKVFQAVCKDNIFPYIYVFGKGYGKGDEPRRAYVLAFGIAVAFICIGELNAIAPLISNFFLMSYALINYSCFDASLAKSPGWRPAFRYYSMWMSLLGAVLCLSVMFVINWWTAVITLALVVFLYVFVHYRKPDINWGSSTQAHVYRSALQHTLKLVSVVDHVKNFRPQVLVLTGYPSDRPALVDFASNITKNISLLICGDIKLNESESYRLSDPKILYRQAYQWLHKRKVKAFYCQVVSKDLQAGAQALLQCGGLGKMKANTLLLGFKSDWSTASWKDIDTYVNILHDSFDLSCGVGVLRIKEGFDHSHLNKPAVRVTDKPIKEESTSGGASLHVTTKLLDIPNKSDQFMDVSPVKSDHSEVENEDANEEEIPDDNFINSKDKEALKNLNIFYRKQKKGTLDVWWLFDDGGLTLLIPYILSTKKNWAHCKLRVFMAGTKEKELDRDKRHMATLLSKFRIEYSSMTVIPNIGHKPSTEFKNNFDDLIKDWKLDENNGETADDYPWKISVAELSAQKDKINRHIRLRELLLEHSRDASLIVMTLPVPRRGVCSALYMAYLDTLTKDMPPMLLLRGNQESVLTYYS